MTPALIDLDDYVAAYEKAASSEQLPELAAFLPPGSSPLRQPVLRELVRVEMELSWAHRTPRRIDEYLARFPELVNDVAGVQGIAFEEFRQRSRAGEHPSPDEYASRYGVEVQDWVVPAPSSRPATIGSTRLVTDPAGKPVQSKPIVFVEEFPPIGEQVAGFRLLAELGRGSFARVYLAQQEALSNRLVALKLTSAPFGHEAQALARLQQTHIVPIYSVHPVGSLVAICMPYFGKLTLAGVIHQLRAARPQLPTSGRWLVEQIRATCDDIPEQAPGIRELQEASFVEAVLSLGARLAEGLHHAHQRGLIHRDLKPANILLTDEGQPMLLDFNLAEETSLENEPTTGQVGGTLLYMAPEYLAGLQSRQARGTPALDIYALGLVLWELLAGEFPFPRRQGAFADLQQRMIADRQTVPAGLAEKNPKVTPAVEAILRHCLEPDPARRYTNAEHLRNDLQCQLGHRPLQHIPEPSLAERARKWARRHPRLTSSGGVLALLVLVLVGAGLGLAQLLVSRNRLEAQQRFRESIETAAEVPVLLATPDSSEESHTQGVRCCRSLIDRYGVLADPGWRQRSLVAHLSPDQKTQLQTRLGEVLWMWARAEIWRGDRNLAQQLNQAGQSCYPKEAIPAVLLRQEAELRSNPGGANQKSVSDPKAENLSPARQQFLELLDRVGKGQWQQALPLLEATTREQGTSPTSWLLLARVNAELGRHEQAAVCAEMATTLAPRWVWAWFHRGTYLLSARDWSRSVEALDRALQLDETLVVARMNRAIALLEMKQPTAALRDLDVALEGGQGPTRLFFLRAQARAQAGDEAGAREDQDEGLRSEPQDEISYITRGLARLPNDPRGALADFDRAVQLNPSSIIGLRNRAHVLSEQLQRTPEAIQSLDRLLEIVPGDQLALAGRGVLQARQGKREEALRDARVVLAAKPTAGLLYQTACIFAITARQVPGDRDEALHLLRKAFRLESRWISIANVDPDLQSLQSDARFKQLLRESEATAGS
ncbi:MAG: protein kinase [Gemmataceae bacterium]